MSLKCENHVDNDAKAVCHHCGRPLCNLTELPYTGQKGQIKKNQLCGYVIQDDYFDDRIAEVVNAVHCENCLLEHHNAMSAPLQRLKSSL
jgi:hypothetical protein